MKSMCINVYLKITSPKENAKHSCYSIIVLIRGQIQGMILGMFQSSFFYFGPDPNPVLSYRLSADSSPIQW